MLLSMPRVRSRLSLMRRSAAAASAVAELRSVGVGGVVNGGGSTGVNSAFGSGLALSAGFSRGEAGRGLGSGTIFSGGSSGTGSGGGGSGGGAGSTTRGGAGGTSSACRSIGTCARVVRQPDVSAARTTTMADFLIALRSIVPRITRQAAIRKLPPPTRACRLRSRKHQSEPSAPSWSRLHLYFAIVQLHDAEDHR